MTLRNIKPGVIFLIKKKAKKITNADKRFNIEWAELSAKWYEQTGEEEYKEYLEHALRLLENPNEKWSLYEACSAYRRKYLPEIDTCDLYDYVSK